MDVTDSSGAALRGIAQLPGPKGLPVLGNVRDLNPATFHQTLENWAREFGPLYTFGAFARRFVVTADNELIAQMLRSRPDKLRRTRHIAGIMEEMGVSGVFNAEGEEWRRQRKLVMRAFTPEVIHNFFPTLTALTERLHLRWHAAIARGETVDVWRDLKAWTLDVTISLAMGQDINTLEHEDNRLQRDIEFIFKRMGRRLVSPLAYWRFIKLPIDHATDAAFARIALAVNGFIAQTRARLEADPALRSKPSNMLEAFVAARDEADSGFTDANVVGNALTMVFAGEDTTSTSSAWLLDFLARDGASAAAMAREADEALGESAVLQDHRALDQMHFTEAATRESMRLKPVAPYMGVEPLGDLQIGDTLIPKGTPIMVLLRHSAERISELEAPEQFRPERWMPEQGAEGSNDPGRTLFPFGGGARFCPGRYLAMAEIKVVMSMLFRNFELELDRCAPPVEERFTFTMTPSALPVRLKLRQPR
ncbi:MAG: cytochrome P450 [Pseudomonadota bacterium]